MLRSLEGAAGTICNRSGCRRRTLPPGRMHDLRSASVNNERLAACAAVHRLHAPLRHFSQQLLADVTAFLDGLRSAAAPAAPPPAPSGGGVQRTLKTKPCVLGCHTLFAARLHLCTACSTGDSVRDSTQILQKRFHT